MELIETPQSAHTGSPHRHSNGAETAPPNYATPGTQHHLEPPLDLPSPSTTNIQTPLSLPVALKLSSAAFAFFVAGANDGSLGALLPYALRGYGVSTGSIAILYGSAFAGWVVAALAGGYVRAWVGPGGAMAVGAAAQVLAFALRVWVRFSRFSFSFSLLLLLLLSLVV